MWKGRGRHGPTPAPPRRGGHGNKARRESLGRESLHCSADDFAQAIDFSAVPVDLIEALAKTLGRMAGASPGERFAGTSPRPDALH